MTHAAALAREDAITDALRAVNDAIGGEQPTEQALRIIEAIKRLRADAPPRVMSTDRVDYLARVQEAARAAWVKRWPEGVKSWSGWIGPNFDAIGSVETPIGVLRMVAWRTIWKTNRGGRPAWAGEYYLNDKPITIAEIRAANLALRPATRNRQKKERTK